MTSAGKLAVDVAQDLRSKSLKDAIHARELCKPLFLQSVDHLFGVSLPINAKFL
jgi:hypothetical protein